uniref:Uncharacterized protein n=1 Tax=candidate division WOR-3 bacterium TaxID=2052148 RepID=A0A7C4CBL6_UNCW3
MRHTTRQTFGQHWLGALIAYVLLDVLMVAAGLGVPSLCILLGLGVGWFGALRAEFFLQEIGAAMRRVLRYAAITAGVTFLLMVVAWWRYVPPLLDPVVDSGSMGVPLILYDPRLSLIGWLVGMFLVAPLAQFLATLAGAYLTFMFRLRRGWLKFRE